MHVILIVDHVCFAANVTWQTNSFDCLQKRNSKWRQAAQQNKLNIVDKHRLLKHHCSLVQLPADPPTFHVGRKAKGKRPAVTVQVLLNHVPCMR